MTIRYECGQCGSILKIKNELAGKPGKCPKCKTRFTVPGLTTDSGEVSLDSGEVSLSDDPPSVARDVDDADESPRNAPASDEEFDPAAFLMQDSPAPTKRGNSKKTAVETSDDDDEFHIRRSKSSESMSKKTSLPLGDDEDDEADQRKVSRAKPAAATGVAASNAAGDLLSQSAKKGRKTSWNEAAPNANADSGFDWEGFGQYVKQNAPMVLGGIVGIVLLFFGANWLMSGSSNLPDLGKVKGQVKMAGQPVVGATVLFHPIRTAEEKEKEKGDKKEKKKKVSSSTAVTDEQGQYELSYVANVMGAPIGPCRIEIEAPSRLNIPKKWMGPNSTEIREVKSGKQVFDLDLSQ